MKNKARTIFKEWVLPLLIIGILWVTGWYKPLVSFGQRLILSTGIITPDTSRNPAKNYGTVDYNWNLVSDTGKPVSFERFRNKVVVVNFFATWCPPCVAEMPGIQELYSGVSSPDIEFIILSRDKSMEIATAFMKKKDYTLPVYMSAGPVPAVFDSQVIPTTYVIAPDGTIVSEHRGMADYGNDKMKNFLRELATEVKGGPAGS